MEEDQEKKLSIIPEIEAKPGSSIENDIISGNGEASDTRIEVSLEFSSLPFKQEINVATFSPKGEYIATYAAKEGKLVIWKVPKRGGLVEEEESVRNRVEPIWHSNQTTTDLKPRDYW